MRIYSGASDCCCRLEGGSRRGIRAEMSDAPSVTQATYTNYWCHYPSLFSVLPHSIDARRRPPVSGFGSCITRFVIQGQTVETRNQGTPPLRNTSPQSRFAITSTRTSIAFPAVSGAPLEIAGLSSGSPVAPGASWYRSKTG